MRRDFALREFERDYLDRLGLPWETVLEGNQNWVIIHGRPVVPGYSVPRTNTALLLPGNYPDTQIDMVYFCPAVQRADNGQIKNLTSQNILGTPYQGWSRHRTNTNPWDPVEDSIETHLILVDLWLTTELAR